MASQISVWPALRAALFELQCSFRRLPGDTDTRCHAPGCGEVANTMRAQQVHADVYEPGVTLPTDGVLLDEEGEA